MSLLGTIGIGGGSLSFSGSIGSIPNEGDYVLVGTEKFIFTTSSLSATQNGLVYTDSNATQSMANLSSAVNSANRSYYTRPPHRQFWPKNDPAFAGDVHYDGSRDILIDGGNGIATVSASISGSTVVTFGVMQNGF